MAQLFPGQLFSLGQLLITRAAADTLDLDDVSVAVRRHGSGDWGDVCQEDMLFNDDALLSGSRLLSSYRDRLGTKFWLITEADRSATTVLLPEDY